MKAQSCAPDEIIVHPIFEAKAGQFTGIIGKVQAKGIEIHDVNLGDPVVAGQFSPGVRRIHFNFYDYFPLDSAEVQPESALIAHGAAMIHAIDDAGLRFGETAVLVGNNFPAELLLNILPVFGIPVHDSAEIPAEEWVDAVFVCSPKPLTRHLTKALLQLRDGGRVISMTKWGVNSYWAELFKKQARIFCPNSFGATLGNPKNQAKYQLPEGYVFRTAKKNLADFAGMLRSGKIQLKQINTKEVTFRNLEKSES